MTIPVIRKRTKKPKTRTGCKTCRARHIKCGEERPACRRCAISGRQCDGYESSVVPLPVVRQHQKLAPAQMLAYSPFRMTAQEADAFELFRSQKTFRLPGLPYPVRWETLAISSSLAEPTIAFAIVAVGSIHRARDMKVPHTALPILEPVQHDFALQQYVRAIASLQEYISSARQRGSTPDIIVVLLASLLFTCFETLQGGFSRGADHLVAGCKILSEHGSHDNLDQGTHTVPRWTCPSDPLGILSQTFDRLDCNAALYGDVKSRFHSATGHERNHLPFEALHMPQQFDSLDEAASRLTTITNEVFRMRRELLGLARRALEVDDLSSYDESEIDCLAETSSRVISLDATPQILNRREHLEEAIAAWSSAMSEMQGRLSSTDQIGCLSLQIQYSTTRFLAMTWRDATERSCDRFERDFISLLRQVEQFLTPDIGSQQFDDKQRDTGSRWRSSGCGSGILVALFLIATKCRDSATRWKAVTILSQVDIQEGVFCSPMLAIFARRIVEVEERRATQVMNIPTEQPLHSADVPEEARFMHVNVCIDPDNFDISRLITARVNPTQPGKLEIEDHYISLSEASSQPFEASRSWPKEDLVSFPKPDTLSRTRPRQARGGHWSIFTGVEWV